MSLLRQLTHGFRGLTRRAARDRDLDEELRQFYDEAAADLEAGGLSPEDARRAARRQLGNPVVAQEEARSYGWENALATFLSDLRFAVRQLRRNPGFAAISILTLALAIGAVTAIFSAIDPVLFRPLPYPHPGRLLMIWNTYKGARFDGAYGTFLELRQRSHSFESMATFEPWQPALTGNAEPERLDGQVVCYTFFHVLGVSPALGRDFVPSDDVLRGPLVVILSDSLWRRQFHADPGIIGRAIRLSDNPFTVIGVMPRGFTDVLDPSAQLWSTEQYDISQIAKSFNGPVWGDHLRIVGRLRPGIPAAQAAQELDAISHNPWPQFPRPRWASLRQGLLVDSLQDDIAHTVRPALLAVFAAVMLVLAIACVNVVNLVLARGVRRRGEFALRGALGAPNRRLALQLLTENLLLAFLGGALGVGVAFAGVRALIALSPAELPRLDAIAVDPAALVFALGLTTLIGLAAGLVPALHVSRGPLHSGLLQISHRVAGHHARTRRGLIVFEVALALTLLISAGLLLHSMRRLLALSPGFDSAHLLTLQVQSVGHQFDNPAQDPTAGDRARYRFFEQALDAVRSVPGVRQAAFTSLLPLSDDPDVDAIYGGHFDNDAADGGRNVFRYAVSPGYVQAMGIPLRSGRWFTERDDLAAPHVALISESLARTQFPGQNPLGRRVKVGPTNQPWFTIVGVVGDVKQTSLTLQQTDAVYIPTEQSWFADDTLSFVVRARGDAASLAPAVKAAIWSVDKNQPIVRVMTMDHMMAIGEAQRRFVLILFEAFALAALLLAALGLYGVLSGSVTERTQEIGIRAALGASRGNLLALILRDGMSLTALGIALGLAGALAAARALASLLYGTSPLDPAAWVGVVLLLALVSALACWLPAHRAARIDPAITLRSE
jgi:putative ABC transport system permease protein